MSVQAIHPLGHSLVKLGDKIHWDSFAKHFNPKVGRLGLPTGLMVSLHGSGEKHQFSH